MKTKIILGAIIGAVVCILLTSRLFSEKRPNAIIICVDALRPDHLGCYGYPKDTSPFLDSLAGKGVIFQNAITQANWTTPSHSSIFTSLYPDVHGVENEKDKLPPSLLTMAEILKRAGYDTAGFVDGGFISTEFGFNRGFDVYDDKSDGRRKDRQLLRWVKERQGLPFFIFYHTYDVHFPYTHHPSPRQFADDPEITDTLLKMGQKQFDLSDKQIEKAVLAWCTSRGFYHMIPTGQLSTIRNEMNDFLKNRWPRMKSCQENLRYLIDAYDGGIRYCDARLRKLWAGLGKMGLQDNTILIVIADHGESFLEHGTLGHSDVLYDEILKIPFIIAYPGLSRKGVRIPQQVMSIDILPTILDIVKVKPPPYIQGQSLLPLMEGGAPSAERPAFSDAGSLNAVRTANWKLIQDSDKKDGKELYDLKSDPGEKTNLSGKPSPALADLETKLSRWRAGNAELRKKLGLSGASESATLSEDKIKELRALGYLQ